MNREDMNKLYLLLVFLLFNLLWIFKGQVVAVKDQMCFMTRSLRRT